MFRRWDGSYREGGGRGDRSAGRDDGRSQRPVQAAATRHDGRHGRPGDDPMPSAMFSTPTPTSPEPSTSKANTTIEMSITPSMSDESPIRPMSKRGRGSCHAVRTPANASRATESEGAAFGVSHAVPILGRAEGHARHQAGAQRQHRGQDEVHRRGTGDGDVQREDDRRHHGSQEHARASIRPEAA